MGMKKVKSDPIDGFTYEVKQLGALEGEKIGAELLAMFAPIVGSLAGEGKATGKVDKIADLDLSSLGFLACSEAFAEKLTSKRLQEIRATMAKSTDIYGEGFGDAGAPLSKNYDEHFAARYDAMLEWFMFALEVNFGGFFGGFWGRMVKRFPVLQVIQKAVSTPQRTSTGESGESSLQE